MSEEVSVEQVERQAEEFFVQLPQQLSLAQRMQERAAKFQQWVTDWYERES